ncbi:class I SAM-dependent methyltransferase [Diaminobutyricibacter sp. McL0608]|uniref:class I SAM-dependent methyltransferase n=1 Tax=Leifsonia sp. McL0608 TaxID=3143537 RepID=UPI0031F310BC
MTDIDWIESTRSSYDTVADSYTDFVDAAIGHWDPFVWAFLDAFAALSKAKGPVLDAGCGPGRVTAHLKDKGLDISGIDLSPRLIEIARTHRPDIDFTVGSITQLPVDAAHLAGIICWWVLHHVPDDSIGAVIGQFFEKLQPGGVLLLGGHLGSSTHTKTEGYGGHPMNVHMAKRPLEDVAETLEENDFVIDLQATLDPRSTAPSLVVLAHKPM